jgi:hypothetical protein
MHHCSMQCKQFVVNEVHNKRGFGGLNGRKLAGGTGLLGLVWEGSFTEHTIHNRVHESLEYCVQMTGITIKSEEAT